jgi:subtilase family serine protease
LQNYLAKFGIHSTAYANGLDVSASGTAGQFDQALQVKQDYLKPAERSHHDGRGEPAKRFHRAQGSPLLPKSLAQFVLGIFGLSNYPAFESHLLRAPQVSPAHKPKVQPGDLTPAGFAKQYNLPHGTGAGTTIGIITFASVDPSVVQSFWSSILGIRTKPGRITLEQVDGGSGPISDASGSGETTIDVSQSGALAPQANIVVYEAANSDAASFDSFAAAASENRADTVSMSWGYSETLVAWAIKNGAEDGAYQAAQDELSLEMAAQGQSMFVSSGDSGAYTATQDLGTTDLSIDDPDDSPWITSAGGTTLPGTTPLTDTVSATIPRERAWGWDWLWPYWSSFGFPSEQDFAFAEIAGGGGGYSSLEPMPDYQRQVGAQRFTAVPYLTPAGYTDTGNGVILPTSWSFNGHPPTIDGVGNGRATPDVSVNADPETGYEVLFTFGDQTPSLETGWGGTSFSAPQLNGSTAVIDGNLGRRVGLWNTSIYSFAQGRNSPFTPLDTPGTSNDNLYYSGVPGATYNAASGLGTPDLSQLQQEFATSH